MFLKETKIMCLLNVKLIRRCKKTIMLIIIPRKTLATNSLIIVIIYDNRDSKIKIINVEKSER